MATSENKTTTVTDEVKEAVVEEKKTTTKTTKKEAELEAQLAAMMEMVKNLQAQVAANSAVQPIQTSTPTVVVQAPSTDVTLVYTSDSLGCIHVNNLELNCSKFGEEFTLSRADFDAVVGKYRHWFDEGILAVSYKNMEVAAAKGVRTDKEYGLDASTLAKLGTMSCAQLEKLWKETTTQSHKESIVSYFKRKFIEGTEDGFQDRAKIDLLNRLTDGGFDREVVELSGRNLKIQPTEII